MAHFNVGDLIRHRTGLGPIMVISSLHTQPNNQVFQYSVSWWNADTGSFRWETFREETLELVPNNGAELT